MHTIWYHHIFVFLQLVMARLASVAMSTALNSILYTFTSLSITSFCAVTGISDKMIPRGLKRCSFTQRYLFSSFHPSTAKGSFPVYSSSSLAGYKLLMTPYSHLHEKEK